MSSNNYFLSQEYMDLLDSTQDFYQSILPVINGTYNSSMASYKNAYTSEFPATTRGGTIADLTTQSSI